MLFSVITFSQNKTQYYLEIKEGFELGNVNKRVSPEITKKYKLEIIKTDDGFKDYDEVEVKVNPYCINTVMPNPATNQIQVDYLAENAVSAYISMTSVNTGTTHSYILDPTATSITIDITTYPLGMYVITLICDGTQHDNKQLIKL